MKSAKISEAAKTAQQVAFTQSPSRCDPVMLVRHGGSTACPSGEARLLNSLVTSSHPLDSL